MKEDFRSIQLEKKFDTPLSAALLGLRGKHLRQRNPGFWSDDDRRHSDEIGGG
jgi:hypothetical protein